VIKAIKNIHGIKYYRVRKGVFKMNGDGYYGCVYSITAGICDIIRHRHAGLAYDNAHPAYLWMKEI